MDAMEAAEELRSIGWIHANGEASVQIIDYEGMLFKIISIDQWGGEWPVPIEYNGDFFITLRGGRIRLYEKSYLAYLHHKALESVDEERNKRK
jgi:hypothetical protein